MAKIIKAGVSPLLWEKIWIIGGDPCLCRFAVEGALENFKDADKQRFGVGESAGLRKALSASNVFGDAVVIVTGPDAEMAKVCLLALEKNFTAAALIVVTPGATLDGRWALATQGAKAKRVYYFPFIEAGDRAGLMAHLDDWSASSGLTLSADCRKWLYSNAPVTMEKIKTAGGSKEAEVISLANLESELEKIIPLKKGEGCAVTVFDLTEYCQFRREVNAMDFARAAMEGDAAGALRILEELPISQANVSPLWLLLSQLGLAVSVKSLQEEGIVGVSQMQSRLSAQEYMGQYAFQNGEEPQEAKIPAAIHPYRLQKTMEMCAKWRLAPIASFYAANIYAIEDIRAGLPPAIVLPWLAQSIGEVGGYPKPLSKID